MSASFGFETLILNISPSLAQLYLNSGNASCGGCDHYVIDSLVKHRTNDIVDTRNNIVQINPEHVQYQIFKQSLAQWSPYRGMLVKREASNEVNFKNAQLNIGLVNVIFAF